MAFATGAPAGRPESDVKESHDARSGVRARDGGALRRAHPAVAGGGEAVTAVNAIGLALAAALAAYLLVALLFPEKF
jgi:K+-transporting ATPase KdpF subunit